MGESDDDSAGRFSELLVLALAPALVLVLILLSWGLAHWRIGPAFLNAGLALAGVYLRGVEFNIVALGEAGGRA